MAHSTIAARGQVSQDLAGRFATIEPICYILAGVTLAKSAAHLAVLSGD